MWRALGLGLVLAGMTPTARAAEDIVITLAPLEVSISVSSLETFVETGEISRDLRSLASRVSPTEQEQLRALLSRRFDFGAAAVDRFAATDVGRRLLTNLSSILITRAPESALSATRAAFVLAAANEGLTLMNAIRYYPLPTLAVDLRSTLNAVNSASQIFGEAEAQVASLRADSYFTEVETEFSEPLHELGRLTWQREPFVFSYDTETNGQRRVISDLYLPEGQGLPLIVIIHGLASSRETFSYLAEHLASWGYAVVALEDPNTNARRYQQLTAGLASPINPEALVQRSRDIPELLDALADNPRIDTRRVGVIGQSLGGATAFHVAGAQWQAARLQAQCDDRALLSSFNLAELLQCVAQTIPEFPDFSDPRIQAVMTMNSIGNTFFGPEGFGQVEIPTLMVAGTSDFIAPPLPEQIEPFRWLGSRDRYLVLVDRGTHFSFLSADSDGAFPVPPELIGGDPQSTRAGIKGLTTAFFGRHILNQADFAPYLSTNYLEMLDQPPFGYHLIRGEP